MAEFNDKETLDALCRADLFFFVQRAFTRLYSGNELNVAWPIQALCYELMECFRGNNSDFLNAMPPRSLKSFCVSVCFPAFCLGHDPSLRFLCLSYGEDLAENHARLFRQIISSDWYQQAFPRMKLGQYKDTARETVTSMNGGRYASTFGGSITGQGADYLIIDDPMKSDDAYSAAERDRIYRVFVEAASTRFNNPLQGKRIVTMQRLHEDDLIGRLYETGKWNHLSIPAVSQEDTIYRLGPGPNDTHTFEKGVLIDPERLSQEYLDIKKLEMGAPAYNAQFLCNPLPADGELIKRSWIKRYTGEPNPSKFDYVVQSWDTAIKTGLKNDYSACVTFGVKGNETYVIDASRYKLDADSLRRQARIHAVNWKVSTVLIEDANLGHLMAQFLHERLKAAILPILPKGPKEQRIAQASAMIEAGRLYLPVEPTDGIVDLEREMYGFPNAANDDLIDALAQFLNWFARREIRDRNKPKAYVIGADGIEVFG